ncbi:hypothetical protein [Trichococcus shcherbakoviae]|uniref:hypothetical protein n=1 Tax=Trichococcus shcherbakoviae TaxID=2094020 RepID=UPI002AA683D9|nr:hypothetical protein [Trichococcus shcherbakoviae]
MKTYDEVLKIHVLNNNENPGNIAALASQLLENETKICEIMENLDVDDVSVPDLFDALELAQRNLSLIKVVRGLANELHGKQLDMSDSTLKILEELRSEPILTDLKE